MRCAPLGGHRGTRKEQVSRFVPGGPVEWAIRIGGS